MKQTKTTIVNEVVVADYLKKNESKLKSYGNKGFDVADFLRSAMILIVGDTKLRKALTTEKGKESLYNALKHAASVGLSLNPQKAHACLIPYEIDGTMIIDYQIMKAGYVQLALDSGKVEWVRSFLVHENDKFELSETMNGDDYLFKPATKDRGKIIGALASLKTIEGTGFLKYMTVKEINEIRDTYSAMYKKKPDKSPWKKSYPGMARKTVIKALFREISISTSMKKAIETDDYFEFDTTERNVTPGFSSQDVKKTLTKPPAKTPEKPQKKEEPKKAPSGKDLF